MEENNDQENNERELFTERKNFMNGLIKLFKNENFNTKNGKVISIDGEWGIGKTFFKDKFMKELKKEGFSVLEYDAWKYDYNEDPFLSIIEIFAKEFKKDKKKKFIKSAAAVAVKGTGVLLNSLMEKYLSVNSRTLEEVFKGSGDAFAEYIENSSEDSIKVENFKKELTNLSEEKKIVILVDELDRCRPNYSIKVLEKIKQFFDVKNFIFIILNKRQQIVESINSIYGITTGDQYLEKFYDLEINLPEPNIGEFLDSLLKNNIYNKNYDEFEKMLFEVFKFYFIKSDLSLRIIEKSFLYYKTIIDTKPNFRTVYQIIFFSFIFSIKIMKNKNYKQGLKINQIYSLRNTTTSPVLFDILELLKIYNVLECQIFSPNLNMELILSKEKIYEKLQSFVEEKTVPLGKVRIKCKEKIFISDYGNYEKMSNRRFDNDIERMDYIKNENFNVKKEEVKFIYDLLEMFDFKNEESEEVEN